MTLQAIKYENGKLSILDQLLLPNESIYLDVKNTEDGWSVINKMQVRGAPAIAIVGSLSLAVELLRTSFASKNHLQQYVTSKFDYLVTARPTAINMKRAGNDLGDLAQQLIEAEHVNVIEMKDSIVKSIESMLENDIADNKAIGDFGARHIQQNCRKTSKVQIVTHCNTGSLATAGYGTALGVIRSLQSMGMLDHVFCTETRPYSQGARLTAYELVFENIPSTLICDSMAAALMRQRGVSAVVVGADRVAANGDTANKIGTYQLAVVAKHHDVPFYVAAPTTSIDLSLANGDAIPIEERPAREMTHIMNIPLAAPGINCWNPAFDVTPAYLITGGIITERGVFSPRELSVKLLSQPERFR